MKIDHIASGSSGNCIVVDDGHSKLVLDAGLSYRKLSRKVRFSEVAGVLITHEHMDHCRAVPELLRRGVDVWMSTGTSDNIHGIKNLTYCYLLCEHLGQIEIGSWKVLPFNVRHDAEEPLGFLFQSSQTGEKGVYIADSAYIEFDFIGVNYWLIEANYSDNLLDLSKDPDWLKDRIRNSHFSFNDLKTFFRTSDMSQTEEIHLIHLSNRNSNEQAFKEELQRTYGVPVYTLSDSSEEASQFLSA